MGVLPELDNEAIAEELRALSKRVPLLRLERESGVSRQVLYRIMGGSPINRSPYELVAKILTLLAYYREPTRSPEYVEEEVLVITM